MWSDAFSRTVDERIFCAQKLPKRIGRKNFLRDPREFNKGIEHDPMKSQSRSHSK